MAQQQQQQQDKKPLYMGLTGIKGYSGIQTVDHYKDTENVMTRRILRSSWNNQFLRGQINNHSRVLDPFRAANHLGDYLSRPYYACGVPRENVPRRRPGWRTSSSHGQCDGTGVTASSCNPRFVSDSSDYIRFKKQSAMLNTYNS